MRFGISITTLVVLLCLNFQLGYSQDEELDLDAMWENTIWEEIKEVTTVEYEVEKVTTTAGVRGAEAEDEALNKLYYRKSMKSVSLLDLQKVHGKLIAKKEKMVKNGMDTKKIDGYIFMLNKKIKL